MTAASQSGVVTVTRFYEFLTAGKFEEAASMLAEDIVIDESTELPYGGAHCGIQEVFKFFGQLGAALEFSAIRREYIGEANTVAVHMRSRFKSKATGETTEMDIVELVTVRDGKIAKIDVYYKDPLKVAALWPK